MLQTMEHDEMAQVPQASTKTKTISLTRDFIGW